MKRVIKGSLYNTETAKLLASWENEYGRRDFNWCSEELYRTKAGKYFIAGEGGPMSKYCKNVGNTTTGGSDILPLTLEEAREWAEEKLTADEYMSLFEIREEGDEKEALNVLIPAHLKDKLDLIKEQTGQPISQIIIEMIEKL